jgi:hypothetical protein
VEVRVDLLDAQLRAWDGLGRPGSWWTGMQRVEIASTALQAWCDPDPLPPWVRPSTLVDRLPHAATVPAVAHDAAYRLTRHAATLGRSWYDEVTRSLDPLAYVELVGIVCTVAAVRSLRDTLGLVALPLPQVHPGEPTGARPPDVVPARMNWVPVAGPADAVAAVVQALSAVPGEFENLWRLADVQYMPEPEMVDPQWTRGALSRAQMELLATRVAQRRGCVY